MTIDEKLAACGGLATLRQLYAWPWLNASQLVERESSRLRLQAWIRAGAPMGPFTVAVVSTTAAVFAAVSAVLATVPPPVAWHASRRVLFAGLDARTAGCASYIPPMPESPEGLDEGPHVVLLRDLPEEHMRSIAAHEIAHVWTSRLTPAADLMPTATLEAARASLKANPVLTPNEHAAMRETARGEELAHVLAYVWGFRGLGADPVALARQTAEAYVMEGITR